METVLSAPVSFTEGAITEIKRLMNEPDMEGKKLRVGVKGGGCSGMSYVLGFDKQIEGDEEFEYEGVPCIMNKTHEIYLYGMQIDWEDGLNSRGCAYGIVGCVCNHRRVEVEIDVSGVVYLCADWLIVLYLHFILHIAMAKRFVNAGCRQVNVQKLELKLIARHHIHIHRVACRSYFQRVHIHIAVKLVSHHHFISNIITYVLKSYCVV